MKVKISKQQGLKYWFYWETASTHTHIHRKLTLILHNH